jgi:hypothetical protein
MSTRWAFLFAWIAAILFSHGASGAAETPWAAVDRFDELSGWSAHPADGVEMKIRAGEGQTGGAMRVDFDFVKGGGYAVAHKAFDIDLPENYAFSFLVRGDASPNHIEFKLIDDSGENVWWSVRRDVVFASTWQTFRIKKRQIQFAWGPKGGGEITHVAAIEFAITAGSGGKGSVWIDDLALQPLPIPSATPPPPTATASSFLAGHEPGFALDGDPTLSWEPRPDDHSPSLLVDLGEIREIGGLTIEWVPGRGAGDYVVEGSTDGNEWTLLRAVGGGNGGKDPVYLPETETRWLRLSIAGGTGGSKPAVRDLTIQPLAWSASRESFFQAIARDAPLGHYPRALCGEQTYWTVVGVDADPREALINEEGMIETGRGAFSIEPFLFLNGRLITWSDVVTEQGLQDGRLPIPWVVWRWGGITLVITAFATGDPGASSVVVRYRLVNGEKEPVRGNLFLAVRPFQVNPPTQFLNLAGGTAPIRRIARDGKVIRVNEDQRIATLSRSSGFGATAFDGGEIVTDYLAEGKLPTASAVEDPFAAASGALAFAIDLPPGGEREVDLLVPLYDASPVPSFAGDGPARDWVEGRMGEAVESWSEKTGRFGIVLPDSASRILRVLQSQLAYILVDRAGPAIQPGTRSYARSWIRDGALTSAVLLRMGHLEAARAFADWYAPYQYANGKIPCVVDARGADPVPEHDSSGEFIFLIAEVYRYSGDRTWLEGMWPRVEAAVGYLDSLRQERRTPEYRTPEKQKFFGLLPESISHEGYSAKPMHSYWDDLFAWRGFREGASLALILGRREESKRIGRIADEFQTDLLASIQAAMRDHGIDYIPGCADLGDIDPTSTAIGLSPLSAGEVLPKDAVERTFEKYYEFFRDRRDGAPWEAFTPYEARVAGAFVRLGWRDRAQELLDFFIGTLRPQGWNAFAEVVWRDPRLARFVGDIPHSWVGSEFARSVLDMFAYDDTGEGPLVLGAGVPLGWLRGGAGVAVKDLPTPHGLISYSMRMRGGAIEVDVGQGPHVPGGGIVVRPPLPGPIRSVAVNGRDLLPTPEGEIVLRALPAKIVIRF